MDQQRKGGQLPRARGKKKKINSSRKPRKTARKFESNESNRPQDRKTSLIRTRILLLNGQRQHSSAVTGDTRSSTQAAPAMADHQHDGEHAAARGFYAVGCKLTNDDSTPANNSKSVMKSIIKKHSDHDEERLLTGAEWSSGIVFDSCGDWLVKLARRHDEEIVKGGALILSFGDEEHETLVAFMGENDGKATKQKLPKNAKDLSKVPRMSVAVCVATTDADGMDTKSLLGEFGLVRANDCLFEHIRATVEDVGERRTRVYLHADGSHWSAASHDGPKKAVRVWTSPTNPDIVDLIESMDDMEDFFKAPKKHTGITTTTTAKKETSAKPTPTKAKPAKRAEPASKPAAKEEKAKSSDESDNESEKDSDLIIDYKGPEAEDKPTKKRGRPKGSKNKAKEDAPPAAAAAVDKESKNDEGAEEPTKKRGRPKGSKNKPKEAEAKDTPAKKDSTANDSDDGSDEEKETSKTKKAKAPAKAKAKKDPNAPKKPSNAYMIFCNTNRERVTEANPDAKATGIVSLLGAEWKSMSDEDKDKYKKMAEDDKARYKKDMEKYAPGSDVEKETEAKDKKEPTAKASTDDNKKGDNTMETPTKKKKTEHSEESKNKSSKPKPADDATPTASRKHDRSEDHPKEEEEATHHKKKHKKSKKEKKGKKHHD